MKTFEIQFVGRKKGAIGEFFPIRTQVFAENEEGATLALYDRFEHIQHPQLKEIPSPFDSDDLVERVQNTSEEHSIIRIIVKALRSEIDRVATRQARANASWHDDEDAPDHSLFSASAESQFPREERDKAVLELVSRHLEVINENEVAK